MNLNLFGQATPEQQERVIKRVCSDSGYIPQFEQRLRTMAFFTCTKELRHRADIFSYVPAERQRVAVGYRIQQRGGKFIAEPWVFIIPDPLKSFATEITTRVPNSLYFGSLVPQELLDQFGTQAYNLMLGNLDLLRRHSFNPISL